MIERLAYMMTDRMEEEKLLGKEMKDEYVYALINIMERGITLASIFCMSLFFKQIISMGLFLIFFLSLRKRTGGYHAEKFWQCYLETLATCMAIIYLCPVLEKHMKIVYMLLAGSIVLISIVGTVNHPNMELNAWELLESKKAARYLVGLESVSLVAAVILNVRNIYICYMSGAIILCALLLVIAKMIKQEVSKSEKE